MALTSPLAWILAGLLVVPLAALGADTIQRGLEEQEFDTPPVRAGERFVYDITVLSDFAPLATTAHELLEVHIGHPQGDDDGVVPIQVKRQPAFWDPHERAPWVSEMELADARMATESHEYVAIENGVVVHHTAVAHEEQYYSADDGAYRYTKQTDANGHPGTAPSIVPALAAQAERTWSHDIGMLGRSSDQAAGNDGYGTDTMVLPLAGTYRDRDVYGRNESRTDTYADGGAPFGCWIDLPPIVYEEPASAQAYANKAVEVTTWHTEWRDPELALPVVVDCHRAYFSDDGRQAHGHLRVTASLVAHERGDEALDIEWSDDPVRFQEGELEPIPTDPHGAPADDDASATEPGPADDAPPAFRFPLAVAHELTIAHLEAEEPGFVSAEEPGFVLIAAEYNPGTPQSAPCAGLAEPLVGPCATLPEQVQTQPAVFVEPTWWITYENEDGERLAVGVLRNMTITGQEVATTILGIESAAHADSHLFYEAPRELVPVHVALVHWLDHRDLDLDEWRQQEAARFVYTLTSLEPYDDDVRPDYIFQDGLITRADAAITPTRAPTANAIAAEYYRSELLTQTFHAEHGALLDETRTAFVVEDGELDRMHATPAAAPLPTPNQYQPISAVIVGAVGLGAVAIGASPVGRNWGRALLALPLFTKLNKEQVLEHRTRDSMLSYVKQNPGVGTEEIRRYLDIGWGTAVYHLSALEQNGILSSMRRGGNRHWFAAGQARGLEREAIALLRSPAARRLHDAIRDAPGRTQQELAATLGVTHGAVIFQVRKLERAGLIRKERDGRYVRYFIGTGGERMPNVPAS